MSVCLVTVVATILMITILLSTFLIEEPALAIRPIIIFSIAIYAHIAAGILRPSAEALRRAAAVGTHWTTTDAIINIVGILMVLSMAMSRCALTM